MFNIPNDWISEFNKEIINFEPDKENIYQMACNYIRLCNAIYSTCGGNCTSTCSGSCHGNCTGSCQRFSR